MSILGISHILNIKIIWKYYKFIHGINSLDFIYDLKIYFWCIMSNKSPPPLFVEFHIMIQDYHLVWICFCTLHACLWAFVNQNISFSICDGYQYTIANIPSWRETHIKRDMHTSKVRPWEVNIQPLGSHSYSLGSTHLGPWVPTCRVGRLD